MRTLARHLACWHPLSSASPACLSWPKAASKQVPAAIVLGDPRPR
ncbi:MAG: hypothetical protein U1E47_05140 [Rivihabitans pingtungensis]